MSGSSSSIFYVEDSTRRSVLSVSAGVAASSLWYPRPVAHAASTTTAVPLPGSKTSFPYASFGLQIYDNDTAFRLTTVALEAGYRNFFASVLAGNQRGFAKAVRAYGIPREELYVCGSVLSNRARGYQAAYDLTQRGCVENMKEMAFGNIDYLDMLMLDYPGPDAESIRGQWRALEDFRSSGQVRDLAVSNFDAAQLDAILLSNECRVKPCVNQLPFSIANHPPGLLEYNRDRNVLVQSWSPLSRVLRNPKLRPVLASIGNRYGKSPAQVALRWIVQSGASFCTQSSNKEHFVEDLNVFDFVLTKSEMEQLGA